MFGKLKDFEIKSSIYRVGHGYIKRKEKGHKSIYIFEKTM
jgi:hypothetical protein